METLDKPTHSSVSLPVFLPVFRQTSCEIGQKLCLCNEDIDPSPSFVYIYADDFSECLEDVYMSSGLVKKTFDPLYFKEHEGAQVFYKIPICAMLNVPDNPNGYCSGMLKTIHAITKTKCTLNVCLQLRNKITIKDGLVGFVYHHSD